MAWKYKTNAKQQHEKSAAAGNMFKPVVCTKRNYGKPCKHCDAIAKLSQSEDEDDKKIAGKCRARGTYYMNVVDMVGKKVNQIYASGITNWKELIENLPDDEGDGVDFTDPDKAYPILLKKTGKGLSTRYVLRISQKPIKIPGKYLNGMFELHTVLDLLDKEGIEYLPQQGKNKFLILPPWGKEAKGDFFYEVFYHWNTDLLGAAAESGDDEFDSPDDDELGEDENYSDDFGDDKADDGGKGDDEAADETEETDSFEDGDDDFGADDAEPEIADLDGMDNAGLIKYAGLKKIKLSENARKAPTAKLCAYIKKKEEEDAPW
jgi:hypothetical protein